MKQERKRALRKTFAVYFERVALMAAAGLIFGQFIPNTEINWRIVVGGALISLVLITLAGVFKQPSERQSIINF